MPVKILISIPFALNVSVSMMNSCVYFELFWDLHVLYVHLESRHRFSLYCETAVDKQLPFFLLIT